MFLNRGFSPGQHMRKDFGTVTKCPHCPKTNITRATPMQITCNGKECRAEARRVNDKTHRDKKRRLAASPSPRS